MNYPFQTHDAGRSQSKRPKQRQDCVIRAIAIAEERPYDQIFDTFSDGGRKNNTGTPKKLWKLYLHAFQRIAFPARAGLARVNLARFTEENPKGRYVLQMAGHLTACIDGVIHDTEPPRESGCVYACWKIK